MNKQEVVLKVQECAAWWILERQSKLTKLMSETMSINPFMTPFIFDYHSLDNFDELVEAIIAKHLMTGHDTGFGKLIDEKILPRVFGAYKLDKGYRASNKPFIHSCFDEIDHVIQRDDGRIELLSLKAGKWTIQLTMAVQLNKAFNEIINDYPGVADNIVVGVFYGNSHGLTDKYRILRGINTGANHNVIDIRDKVHVYAGKEFWSWLNNGEDETQHWVLEGIERAVKEADIKEKNKELIERFKEHVAKKYNEQVLNADGTAQWHKLLKMINE